MEQLIGYVLVAAFCFFVGWKVGNKKDFPLGGGGGGGRGDDTHTDVQ